MKLICDCGKTVHDEKQAPIGRQPDCPAVTIDSSVAFWLTVSKEHGIIQRLLDIVCDCGRVFVRVDVVP